MGCIRLKSLPIFSVVVSFAYAAYMCVIGKGQRDLKSTSPIKKGVPSSARTSLLGLCVQFSRF